MNKQDEEEFNLYLANCTDSQVQGVFEKERDALREDYAELAYLELCRRGIAHN